MSGEDVLTVEPTATLEAAARKMRDRNVGAAVVVDDRGGIAGIFTERDLLRAVAGGVKPERDDVRSHMTSNPVTLPPDHSPSEAAQIMSEGRFRHIPVVDAGELVGIVSIRDLVQVGLHIQTADAHMGTDFP
jgi:CBS domain-containing protein